LSTKNDAGKAGWLLAVDGSDTANQAARFVAMSAKALGVRAVTLVTVSAPRASSQPPQSKPAPQRELDEAAVRDSAAARAILKAAGLAVSLDAPVSGDPASAIVSIARRRAVSEIVMGTRGLSAMANLVLGSVAYKVLHIARTPVTLVPIAARQALAGAGTAKNALVWTLAADGSRVSNRAAAYVCAAGAGLRGFRVVAVNVQPKIVSGNVTRFVSRSQVEAHFEAEGAKALRGTLSMLDEAGIAHEARVAAGSTAEAILGAAHEARCGRIVLGTRGLAAAGSVILGSTAYGIVHRSDLPITVVR
jgi:nucleotide-binding universal stress UspA family protein